MFDDSRSPEYQKFKVDKLPIILKFEKQDYQFLLQYYEFLYSKKIKAVQRRNGKTIPEDTFCPRCSAPHHYIYDNNDGKGQYQCKVCGQTFNTGEIVKRPLVLTCPYCGHTLVPKKDRKHFRVHKCTNKKCSYYLSNLRKLPKDLAPEDKHKYKLHYIYREFSIDFFKMDLHALPRWATNFKFRRQNAHVMGLCLTYHVNLGLSLRKTAQALKEVHNINISHTMVANYARTASVVIKPFIDTYDYQHSNSLAADETYIKVRGVKGYVWFIMDVISRSILGYQVSDTRATGPCILAMRMAFEKFKKFPGEKLEFVADGYSAYPLASQQFMIQENKNFDITQVIGLTNDDPVSTKYRPFKQKIERLNRTFKASYRVTCDYGSDDGATYGVGLWVAYYNFLRPHKLHQWKRSLNDVDMLRKAENMPAKWQLLIFLGQQTILTMQKNKG
ncbi:DDE-type integrase/transposase/recombinase [Alkaliphilus hydrothermalis]|uniref:Transposase-like protein/DNA-directed RNA polymerase subunit RPC12/RpoP n=1 Tax=Alkaliphilus hydrothermalis TaxID=1482730 RepID=A0ABS2NRM4_9FIRM|nr:transposase-like protein/DNA-directed RNA polymerase subunit RPC12/RpoP [Alkaliphilus hydrothermalis]